MASKNFPREVKRLLNLASQQGFEWKDTRHGVVVYGKDGTSTAWLNRNPGGSGLKNMKADLKRLGVKID